MLFASDFGQLVPWWFYALLAIPVAVPVILMGISLLVALVRTIRKPSQDSDLDEAR